MTKWVSIEDSSLSDIDSSRYGLKGSALLHSAQAGLPVSPGAILPIGESLKRHEIEFVIDNLEQKLGALGHFGPQGFRLYLRATLPDIAITRPPSLLHLGIDWKYLSHENTGWARLTAFSLCSLLSMLSGKVLPTLDDFLEEEEFETFMAARRRKTAPAKRSKN